MRSVLLIGSSGQLGSDLRRRWEEDRPGDRLICLTHAEVEVANRDSVREAVLHHRAAVVINTSAYHRVDAVEDDPERAFLVNAAGPHHLALACREADAVLVHFSTDYVFSGAADRPYIEDDAVGAVNVYGVSKAAGEMLVRNAWGKHFIVRTSGLYGVAGSSGKGGNFVETMLRLATAGQEIRVVDDQVLTPTHTAVLAAQVAALVESAAYGTYHATCQGECSWYEFAKEIFRQAGLAPALRPQTTAESGARAARPARSVLENRGLQLLGLDQMPAWEEALSVYLAARSARETAPAS
ncbi:MAG TPA: dTDP-4-dehydrorhamnose reductase [Candidatus Dormibacteraeota bacterium]|nr:dTDP-4-dehydrorhamnose reductase [Candidatus Dormibacteraeota bacterium]